MSRFLVLTSKFNADITQRLLDGTLAELTAGGVKPENIDVKYVPGSFELPQAAAKALHGATRYAAIIAVGCVIRGDTPHFDYISAEATRGLMELGLQGKIPVVFGVLTTENEEQAYARCGISGPNKGREFGRAALEMVEVYKQLEEKR